MQDKHHCGRPSKFTEEIAAFMEDKLREDDKISSIELHRLISKKFQIDISPPAIRTYIRRSLQWVVVRTRFGPMISDANKVKRKQFAQMCIDTNDNFDNVIWTDESSIQLTRHSQTMRVKVGEERILKPAAKHSLKVHVWAGISKRGATHICVFDQIIDGAFYIKILEDFLLPFISERFHDTKYRFMQDNDPKHTSCIAKEFYKEKGINWWPTPASSADFNPIERVWRELKFFIARYVKPLNKKELVEGICQFWSQRMSTKKCIKYIDHTFSVLPKIVAKEGGITGE